MKITPILLLLLFVLNSLFSEAKDVPGVIYRDNDSIKVVMKIPILDIFNEPKILKLQTSIRYTDRHGKTTNAYPSDIQGFKFKYEGISYRLKSIEHSGSLMFLLVKVDDYLSLYFFFEKQYELSQTTRELPVLPSRYLLQIKNYTPIKPRPLRFSKDMRGYFEDCPELAQKIEDKTLQFYDIIEIVDFYNYDCE